MKKLKSQLKKNSHVAKAQPTAVKEPVKDTIEMIQETAEAITQDTVDAVKESAEEAKSVFDSNVENAELIFNKFIEFNESAYKSGEILSHNIYENHVSNVNAMFTGFKALSVTTTPIEFYRVVTENNSAAIDLMKDQYHTVSALNERAMQETIDASKKACLGIFPATT